MDNKLAELQGYVVINTTSTTTPVSSVVLGLGTEFKWSVNQTKQIIDFYSKYRKLVGTFQIKNVKMLWQRIAEELCKINILVTSNNCHNRWKVLERNYKNFVDDQKETEVENFLSINLKWKQYLGRRKMYTVDTSFEVESETTITEEK
ncbi:uncharacterized protein [Diabrotica undecimpunctata]|uniref:uncharacterized protein isoform X1 n=1 Tax=Diabrotica undecimpunctata TaxID=50387 RepID=UPI003B641076